MMLSNSGYVLQLTGHQKKIESHILPSYNESVSKPQFTVNFLKFNVLDGPNNVGVFSHFAWQTDVVRFGVMC